MGYHETPFVVRFPHVDAFSVAWHGQYAEYFELGRLDLCERFGLSHEDMRRMGYYAPVVELHSRFRAPARYNDSLVVKTSVEFTSKAMITFRGIIHRPSDNTLIAEGYTTHAVLTLDGAMLYSMPGCMAGPLRAMGEYLASCGC